MEKKEEEEERVIPHFEFKNQENDQTWSAEGFLGGAIKEQRGREPDPSVSAVTLPHPPTLLLSRVSVQSAAGDKRGDV